MLARWLCRTESQGRELHDVLMATCMPILSGCANEICHMIETYVHCKVRCNTYWKDKSYMPMECVQLRVCM